MRGIRQVCRETRAPATLMDSWAWVTGSSCTSSIRGAKSASLSAIRRSSPAWSTRSKPSGRRNKPSRATLQAARHALKRNLKANMKKLSPLDPLVREALREVVSKTDGSATLTTREMKDTVEKAVREAVRERVQEMSSESGASNEHASDGRRASPSAARPSD